MENILFIHGFGGDKTSSTGQNVKSVLTNEKADFTFTTDTFELMDYEGTLSQIDKLVKENNITTIIAHSFGAFYALAYTGNVKKIIINPCMEPSNIIPKLLVTGTPEELVSFEKYFGSSNDKFEETFKAAEDVIYNPEKLSNNKIFGIFAKSDELFSFKNKFANLYPSEKEPNLISVEGGHKIGIESLEQALPVAMKYINS